MTRSLAAVCLLLPFFSALQPSYAAEIAWVNEDRGGGGGDVGVGEGGLEWADDQWRALMEDNGHTIIAHGDPYFLDIDLEEDRLDLLNSADLVIVSRDSNSGEYDDSEEEIQAWTEGVTVPMLILTPFHMRNSRWRMVDTGGQVDAFDNMEVVEPTHPIFEGVALDGANEVEIWDGGELGDGDNLDITDALDVGNGQLLAMEAGTEFPWIILWEKGTEFYDGSDTIAGNTRLFFGAGSDDDPNSWGEKNITPAGDQIFLNAIDFLTGGAGGVGDFNGDGELNGADLDLLAEAQMANDLAFDLNSDGMTDENDRSVWINDIRGTWVGDSNLDGEFNSGDFVFVFTAGQYEDGTAGNSTWATGDWNGDKEFDSGDFVFAFSSGGFELGPRAAVASVPEPSSWLLGLLGFAIAAARRGK